MPNSKKDLWESNKEAKPLFKAEYVEELSIKWNYYLNKWIIGVLLRSL
ncbi:MAG: hypothetical protein ACM3VV_05390 [Deltaproteobacteria bacterium]